MTVGFTDWTDLGFFPLQDHEQGVPLGMRLQLAAGRIVTATDPSKTEDPAETVQVVGEEGGMGTIGDVWPWAFWQTRDRDVRATGCWSQSWPGITVDAGSGGPITGPRGSARAPGVLPIITSVHGVDGRMRTKFPNWPKSFPQLPEGWDVVLMPGMEETAQHIVQLSADPRIVVSNVMGPGACSTLFVDLQPESEPCMAYGGKEPGQDGRAARTASMFKVIPLNANSAGPLGAGDYNGIAWNCSLSKQESALGYGMCWIRMKSGGSGPITPVERGPITPVAPPIRGPITPMRPGYSGSNPVRPNYGKATMGGPSFFGGLDGGDKGDSPGEGSGGEPPILNAGRGTHGRNRETPDDWGEFKPLPQGGHGVTFIAQVGACGPVDGGYGQGDKHAFGTDLDGNPMVSAHINTNAYFIKDAEKDAPLEFQGIYPPDVKTAPLKVEVTLDYDPGMTHKWVQGSKPGLWRWWSTTHICIPDTPMDGPVTPMDGPVTPVTPVSPMTPSPVTPGPITPMRGTPVSGPITPMRVAVAGPITPMRRAYTGPNPVKPNYGRPITPMRRGGDGPITQGPIAPGPIPPMAGPMTPMSGPITPVAGSPVAPTPVSAPPPDDQSWERIPAQNHSVVGGNGEVVSSFQVYHPLMGGYSAMSFRPIAWVMGEQSFIHDNSASSDDIHCAEQQLPQVLSLHAFGGLDSGGNFNYTQDPFTSRARGGTAQGGFMFTPPHLEPEDYFFETGLDVETKVDTGLVLVTPHVNLGFGKPTVAGGIDTNGIVIRVDPASTQQLDLSQNVGGTMTSILTAKVVGTDPFVNFRGTGTVRLPTGTTAQRPGIVVDGEVRVNSTLSRLEYNVGAVWIQAGTSDVANYDDLGDVDPKSLGSPNDVNTIDATGTLMTFETPAITFSGNPNELIRTDGGGQIDSSLLPAAVVPTWLALSDTPGSFTAFKIPAVNTGATALHFPGPAINASAQIDGGAAKAVNFLGAAVAGDLVEVVQAVSVFFPFGGGTITGATTISSGGLTMNDNVKIFLGTSGGEGQIYSDGTNFNIDTVGAADLRFGDDIYLRADDRFISFGTGEDAHIFYDGTDLIIDPNMVGSGAARVRGEAEVEDELRVEAEAIIGSTSSADASAVLELSSTTKGFLPPRMTTTQKNNISSPAEGLIVYDETDESLFVNVPDGFGGFQWERIEHALP